MAFTQLGEKLTTADEGVAAVLELRTAIEERTGGSFSGLPGSGFSPDWPDITNTANFQDTAGECISLIREWITLVTEYSYFYKDGGGVYEQWVPYTLEELFNTAGYPDGWITEYDVENANLYIQLQDIIALMIRYKRFALIYDNMAYSPFVQYGSGATAQLAWEDLLAQPLNPYTTIAQHALHWNIAHLNTGFIGTRDRREVRYNYNGGLYIVLWDVDPLIIEAIFCNVNVQNDGCTTPMSVDCNQYVHEFLAHETRWVQIYWRDDRKVIFTIVNTPENVPFPLPQLGESYTISVAPTDINGFFKLRPGHELTYG